jgi:hypothetical protein
MRRAAGSILIAFAAAMAIVSMPFIWAGHAAPPATPIDLPGKRPPNAISVDVELVLAVDISYSMDPDELALQRDGYAQALVSHEFLTALRGGMHGKVALTYVEWAGASEQRVIIPWRLIDGPASAEKVSQEIAAAPLRRAYRTSISGALRFAAPLFETSGYSGIRRVIDVSGDGANNQGPLVTVVRDDVLAKGITINGLPIMVKRPNASMSDIANLDVYYEDCVIGGPGAFVVPIYEHSKFAEAIRTKLVLEIAGRVPEARVIPASAAAPRVSCTIGERMWQERWGSGGIDYR